MSKAYWADKPWLRGQAGNTVADEGPSPQDLERSDDAQYAGDFATLVAIFRTDLASHKQHLKPNVRFAGELRHVAHLLLDGWGSSDAQFPQQCFEDHGPGILLRALAKAYEQPNHVLGALEGD
jgi:hypothetical protein